jgi:RNA polymerase subunit RPABC4/transcription elongation factor Spt4
MAEEDWLCPDCQQTGTGDETTCPACGSEVFIIDDSLKPEIVDTPF